MSSLRIRLTLIAVVVLAGWGAVVPGASGQSPVEVRLSSWTTGEAYNTLLENTLRSFEQANPNIKVELEIRPIDGYWDKLQTEFAAGTAPDVTINAMDWVVPGAARGMFVDLKPYMTRDQVDLNAYVFPHEAEWGWKGGIYGGFYGASGQALYINKNLLEAANLEMPTADWTWDDMVAYARQLTDPAQNQWGLHIPGLNPPYWGTSFIHGTGGTVLNEARDKCTLTEPQAQAGLQFLADLIHEEKVMPAPGVVQGQENPFHTGKVGMFFGGTWEIAALRSAAFEWDFAPMPVNAETGLRSVQLGTNAWSVLSTSEHQDEAWQVVKFLMGEEGAKGMAEATIPLLRSVVESQEYRESLRPQHIEVVVNDWAEYGHDYYPTPDAGEWWTAVDQELSVIWSGEATVAEATERACRAVDEIFARRPPEWNA